MLLSCYVQLGDVLLPLSPAVDGDDVLAAVPLQSSQEDLLSVWYWDPTG